MIGPRRTFERIADAALMKCLRIIGRAKRGQGNARPSRAGPRKRGEPITRQTTNSPKS